MRKLRVGDTCVWYQHGDRSSDPAAAIVTRCSANGAVDLQVFVSGAAGTIYKRNVYWIDSPTLQEKPSAAIQFGAYDYIETADTTLAKREDERLKVIRTQEEQEARRRKEQASEDAKNATAIVAMHHAGKAPVDIAQEMSTRTGQAWTYQRINSILKNAGSSKLPTVT